MAKAGRTRLAPSPTGALHLGNARTFLINWALAKQQGWEIILRIDDLDGPRVKKGADALAIEDLRWLGMDWDEGPIHQKTDLQPYLEALRQLGRDGLVYQCVCSRKQIEQAASAPQEGATGETRYPGTHRPEQPTPIEVGQLAPAEYAWRLRTEDREIVFNDVFAGEQRVNVFRETGDFVVATKEGLPAYQLAVVVDDYLQGVSDVVRADDLLSSTGRQLTIYKMLYDGASPRHTHVPLVRGEDGRRLAKRHGDTRVATYRSLGVAPERVIGLLAEWCGLGRRTEMSAQEFAAQFDLQQMPHEAVTFNRSDHEWLVAGK